MRPRGSARWWIVAMIVILIPPAALLWLASWAFLPLAFVLGFIPIVGDLAGMVFDLMTAPAMLIARRLKTEFQPRQDQDPWPKLLVRVQNGEPVFDRELMGEVTVMAITVEGPSLVRDISSLGFWGRVRLWDEKGKEYSYPEDPQSVTWLFAQLARLTSVNELLHRVASCVLAPEWE